MEASPWVQEKHPLFCQRLREKYEAEEKVKMEKLLKCIRCESDGPFESQLGRYDEFLCLSCGLIFETK